MKWSNEKPTKPGWYWHQQWNGKRYLTAEIVEIADSGPELIVALGDRIWSLSLVSNAAQWAGPIEEPTNE